MSYLSLIIISSVPYAVIASAAWVDFRTPPTLAFAVNILGCLIYHALFVVSCRRTGYGLLTVTTFFFWVFMGIAPVMCLLTGRWLWGDMSFEMSDSIIKAQLLSILFMGIFMLTHHIGMTRLRSNSILFMGSVMGRYSVFRTMLLSVIASIIVFAGLGVSGTFLRSGYDGNLATGISALFVHNFIRPLPILIAVPILWLCLGGGDRQRSGGTLWLAVIAIFIAFAINFPFSVARFYGWMVISVFFYYLVLHRNLFRSRMIVAVFLISGFFASFGADAVRYARNIADVRRGINTVQAFSIDKYFAGHVDAFEMLVYGTEYVDEKGPIMGYQALGVVLFWVPRSMWPTKPLPTGALLGGSYINLMKATANTNLSAPIVMEGYINFGTLGVAALGFILGWFAGIIDKALLLRRNMPRLFYGRMYLLDALAAPLIGLWIYLLRGALMSTFAYTSAILVAGVVGWALVLKRVREKRLLGEFENRRPRRM